MKLGGADVPPNHDAANPAALVNSIATRAVYAPPGDVVTVDIVIIVNIRITMNAICTIRTLLL